MNTARIRVKFLAKAQESGNYYGFWLRQFPNRVPSWGNCDFVFEQDCHDYDWLVVYDDFPKSDGERFPLWTEQLPCPQDNTLLVTYEPSTIKNYGRGFVNQFGWVLSSQEPWAIKHPRVIASQTGYIWLYGSTDDRGSYDSLRRQSPPTKPFPISTVCSAKQMRHTVHHLRYQFTQRLKAALPELEVFGHGVRAIPDKADALDPFRLHLAVENHLCRHHWTEKLSDSFLGFCLPIYHGCPNAADYFPEESFIPIAIGDFDEAFERITRALRDDEYTQRLPAIIEARRRILDHYALFPLLARLIEERHQIRGEVPLAPHTIRSRRAIRHHDPLIGLTDGIDKTVLKVRHWLARRAEVPSGVKPNDNLKLS